MPSASQETQCRNVLPGSRLRKTQSIAPDNWEDWTVKETVRAKLRVMVKRIFRKYGYPVDKQEKATETVMQQAELPCADWAA